MCTQYSVYHPRSLVGFIGTGNTWIGKWSFVVSFIGTFALLGESGTLGFDGVDATRGNGSRFSTQLCAADRSQELVVRYY